MPPPREKNENVLKARALRRNMTLPEGMLWLELRKRPGGLSFDDSIRSEIISSISTALPCVWSWRWMD